MRWREYPKEKPTSNAYDDPVWVFCCDTSRVNDPDFLGQLMYKPEYQMFFKVEVRSLYGEVATIEKPVEFVTHFAFEEDIIFPEVLK